MTDWVTWPIFVLQLIAFILVLFKPKTKVFGIRLKTIAIAILTIAAFAIVISLYHDSTDVLHIYL